MLRVSVPLYWGSYNSEVTSWEVGFLLKWKGDPTGVCWASYLMVRSCRSQRLGPEGCRNLNSRSGGGVLRWDVVKRRPDVLTPLNFLFAFKAPVRRERSLLLVRWVVQTAGVGSSRDLLFCTAAPQRECSIKGNFVAKLKCCYSTVYEHRKLFKFHHFIQIFSSVYYC